VDRLRKRRHMEAESGWAGLRSGGGTARARVGGGLVAGLVVIVWCRGPWPVAQPEDPVMASVADLEASK
jgi:hypothetical protein